MFSSEEYSDYANTEFNDVFGFFVNGTNCALVPGTTEPVSVNTINDGNDEGGDTTPHNAQFFINNIPPTLNTQMDGLTTVLTCTATVNADTTNHMKLAIADASDDILDSAVFIQAQSLSSGTTISTSLSGGGQHGPSISVSPNTAVIDAATLGGPNASNATGAVTYNVYSDAGCTDKVSAGTPEPITTPGSLPNSEQVTLSSPGTFYWQAVYSGDSNNNGVSSACGSETETVTGSVASPDLNAVIQVETKSALAGETVNISSLALESSCKSVSFETLQGGSVSSPTVMPNSIPVILDGDGNATVVVNGVGCVPGKYLIEADMPKAPYLSATTTLVAHAPHVTPAGLTGYPADEVETGNTPKSGESDVYTVFYVETNAVNFGAKGRDLLGRGL